MQPEDVGRRHRIEALLERDTASRSRGVELVRASADEVEIRMRVGELDTNGVGVAHGGIAYFLADSAAGLASNSLDEYARVTASATMTYLAPAAAGEQLSAVCVGPVAERGRSSVFTVEVKNEHGDCIAVLHESLTRLRPARATDGDAS